MLKSTASMMPPKAEEPSRLRKLKGREGIIPAAYKRNMAFGFRPMRSIADPNLQNCNAIDL